MADEETDISFADSAGRAHVDDGRWKASDGQWYAASDHPDPVHRAKWTGPSYGPFSAAVAPDELPVIAVQPQHRPDDQPADSSRITGRRVVLLVVVMATLVGISLILARLLG